MTLTPFLLNQLYYSILATSVILPHSCYISYITPFLPHQLYYPILVNLITLPHSCHISYITPILPYQLHYPILATSVILPHSCYFSYITSFSGVTGGGGGQGEGAPRDFWPGNICWRIGKKEVREKWKRGKIDKKRREVERGGGGGKLEIEVGKVKKRGEDLFFFFSTEICFGSTKMGIFLREKIFHAEKKKIRKHDFAPDLILDKSVTLPDSCHINYITLFLPHQLHYPILAISVTLPHSCYNSYTTPFLPHQLHYPILAKSIILPNSSHISYITLFLPI